MIKIIQVQINKESLKIEWLKKILENTTLIIDTTQDGCLDDEEFLHSFDYGVYVVASWSWNSRLLRKQTYFEPAEYESNFEIDLEKAVLVDRDGEVKLSPNEQEYLNEYIKNQF